MSVFDKLNPLVGQVVGRNLRIKEWDRVSNTCKLESFEREKEKVGWFTYGIISTLQWNEYRDLFRGMRRVLIDEPFAIELEGDEMSFGGVEIEYTGKSIKYEIPFIQHSNESEIQSYSLKNLTLRCKHSLVSLLGAQEMCGVNIDCDILFSQHKGPIHIEDCNFTASEFRLCYPYGTLNVIGSVLRDGNSSFDILKAIGIPREFHSCKRITFYLKDKRIESYVRNFELILQRKPPEESNDLRYAVYDIGNGWEFYMLKDAAKIQEYLIRAYLPMLE